MRALGTRYLRCVPETLASALRRANERLSATSSSPRSDAEELLSRLVGIGRGELPGRGPRELRDLDLERLEQWLARRERGEPVQYITGRAAFRSLDLAVDRRVLIPRPETEGLVECVVNVLKAEARRWPEPRVVDLGTGSGAIALAIAQEHPAARVLATDASESALDLARANATAAGLADRVELRRGDWLDALSPDERLEVIVSNPPYIATTERDALPDDVLRFEPAEALFSGATGLDALREIVDEAPRHLVAGGLLALELAESRAAEIHGWLDGAHDWSGVELIDDLSGQPRVLLARRERGPAIAPAQWPEERERG